MKLIRLALLAFLVGSLAACATAARRADMAIPATQAPHFPATLKNNVTVTVVDGGEATNPFWLSKVGNADFAGALKLSLANSGLLSDRGRYDVTASIESINLSGLFNSYVDARIRYKVIDTQSANIILDTTVKSKGAATMSDTLLSGKRPRLANEEAVRNSIRQFLDQLAQVKVVAQR